MIETFNDLMEKLHEHLPGSIVSTTKDGKIVVTTGSMILMPDEDKPNGKAKIVRYKPPWERKSDEKNVSIMGHVKRSR